MICSLLENESRTDRALERLLYLKVLCGGSATAVRVRYLIVDILTANIRDIRKLS